MTKTEEARKQFKERLQQAIVERATRQQPVASAAPVVAKPAASEPCEACEVQPLVEAAERNHYKTLEYLLRAESECGARDDVRAEIRAVRYQLESLTSLRILCEKTQNMLGGKPKES